MKVVRVRRGRPQKFGRPSRAVTLTLPEDVIGRLTAIDEDLGRAVVRMALPLKGAAAPLPPAELSKYGDSAVIVVKRTSALEQIPGVTLVPLPDGRALISLDDTMSLSDFELKLRDVIDETAGGELRDRAALASIAEILKTARRTRGITVHLRSIIVLQSNNHRRAIVG